MTETSEISGVETLARLIQTESDCHFAVVVIFIFSKSENQYTFGLHIFDALTSLKYINHAIFSKIKILQNFTSVSQHPQYLHGSDPTPQDIFSSLEEKSLLCHSVGSLLYHTLCDVSEASLRARAA